MSGFIRRGDQFDSGDADAGLLMFEEAKPVTEPDDPEDAAEPWATGKPGFRDRLTAYLEKMRGQ